MSMSEGDVVAHANEDFDRNVLNFLTGVGAGVAQAGQARRVDELMGRIKPSQRHDFMKRCIVFMRENNVDNASDLTLPHIEALVAETAEFGMNAVNEIDIDKVRGLAWKFARELGQHVSHAHVEALRVLRKHCVFLEGDEEKEGLEVAMDWMMSIGALRRGQASSIMGDEACKGWDSLIRSVSRETHAPFRSSIGPPRREDQNTVKRCFECGSTDHLRFECPRLASQGREREERRLYNTRGDARRRDQGRHDNPLDRHDPPHGNNAQFVSACESDHCSVAAAIEEARGRAIRPTAPPHEPAPSTKGGAGVTGGGTPPVMVTLSRASRDSRMSLCPRLALL